MDITAEQLRAEAGDMALELRLKNRAIRALEAELAALRTRVAELESPAEPGP